MKPWLCAAGVKLREQINECYPDRDKRSDGWIGDSRHAATKSDHNPDGKTGVVRAIDIDSDLGAQKNLPHYLADQLRTAAKSGDNRIAYIIFNKKIASPILNWKWRNYKGIDPHTSHLHISFTKAGDKNGLRFNVPVLENEL